MMCCGDRSTSVVKKYSLRCARQIFHENPADGNKFLAPRVPVCRPRDDGHLLTTSAVPGDVQPPATMGVRHDGLGRGLLVSFDARPALRAGLTLRRWTVEIGVRIELADERQTRMTGNKPRESMRPIAAVDGKEVFPLGKPPQ